MHNNSAPRTSGYSEASYPQQQLSGLVIAAGYAVHNALGFGFLESVYRKAMVAELMHRGASVRQEVPFHLMHRGVEVGAYRADIVADGRLIVEVKFCVRRKSLERSRRK